MLVFEAAEGAGGLRGCGADLLGDVAGGERSSGGGEESADAFGDGWPFVYGHAAMMAVHGFIQCGPWQSRLWGYGLTLDQIEAALNEDRD